MKKTLCNVSVMGALLFSFVKCAFYECQKELNNLTSDSEALLKIKDAHNEKYKFSSECLEILLKKNFFLSSEYLMSEYYPKTSIDTEVILKNVANDIKRSQEHLIF
jgi:hypothetical protein